MILRPYQRGCLDSIDARFQDARSTLAVLATGLGKTVCFATLAHEWQQGRVMVMAHREELITQAAEKIHTISGESPGIEAGDERVHAHDGCKVVVSSVQTLSRHSSKTGKPERLHRFSPDDFGLLVIDEAHHAPASTYRTVIEYFARNQRSKLLGVTATPKRADGLAMGQAFETVAYDYGIEPASEDGWLAPVHQRVVKVDGLDFSAVRTSNKGDFVEGELEAILNQEKMLHAVVAPTIEMAGDLPALVFCVTIEHAQLLCDMLNRYKPGSAAAICKDTPKDRRRELIRDYKACRLQFLLSVGVFTEGFDAPSTALIVMARPTKSIVVYTQAIGRGTRPLPGVIDGLEEATPEERRNAIATSAKPHVLVLDFAGNAGRHKIIQAADLLGGKYASSVRDYAKANAETDAKPMAVDDALKRAADEMAFLEEERERARIREKIKADAEYRSYAVSIFGGSEAKSPAPDKPQGGASQKQVDLLVKLGVRLETAMSYGKKQASAVIDDLMAKRGWKRRDDNRRNA